MKKATKIKIFIGLFYLLAVCLFLFFFFSKLSFEEITSYEFVKNNRDYFFELKRSNLILFSLIFSLFCRIWVFAGGFGSPIVIFAGFVFGNWLGTFLLIIGMTIGSTGLYIFANYFFKDLIKEKFSVKFKSLDEKFKESEFLYLLVYRFVGGIPFAISNVLPCIFNVKVFNFAGATFIGMLPQIFVLASIASGLEKIIDQNLEPPDFFDVVRDPGVYTPLIAFFVLIILTLISRKLFYNK